MAAITSSVGLISGINTGAIITALINADAVPVSLLQTQINNDQTLNTTYQGLGSQLTTLQTTAQSLEQASTFQAASTSSSDPSVLTATAATGAAVGSYSLQVAQLVTTQQLISTGFSDPNNTPVGAGTITIEEGGGGLATQTPLSELNGGAGVGRGQFRITDRSGATAVIDTTSAVTLDDVVNDINNATGVSVRASIQNNHLVLTDTSGGTGDLSVEDLGQGTSAADLGIAGSTATSTLTGSDINYISTSTSLTQLNDGRGITLGSGGGDFNINLSNGSTVSVNLATAKTVGDVINAINSATGNNGKVTASIPSGSTGIKLTDNTTGNGTFSVTDINGSQAAAGLGILTSTTGKTIDGTPVIASLDSTLLSSLNGGSGITPAAITFTDRSGHSSTVSFAGATSVQDIINDINNNGTADVQASLNTAGNGIQITDTSGGTGNLTIADAGGGTFAEQLGINGTFGTEQTSVQGSDLQKQWVTNNTLLSSLNGGKGIDQSEFTITNSKGAQSTVNLASGNITTVGDLLAEINSIPNSGVTASINSAGNGLLLTDTAGGAGKLTVKDVNGTAAQDLNIAGTATGTTLNGAYEKTITVTSNDTLATVEKEINNLNFGVNATIINDGSSVSPYRLSLTAQNSGTAGAVTVDTGTTNLGVQTLVAAQDAAVFVGSSTTQQPLLITSSTNQVANVIQGVTLDLNGVSSDPVQLSVTQNTSGIALALGNFVTNFNSLISQISTQSTYDTSTNTAGLLLGDPVASAIQSALFNSINTTVGTGTYRSLAQLGITVGTGGQLTFDQDTFNAAIATDPDAVENLFNATTTTTTANGSTNTVNTGIAYVIDNAINQLVTPVNGIISASETGLTNDSQQLANQIQNLNDLLAQQKSTLQQQFDNMESVLATLQTQQSSLSSITGLSTSSSSSSSSKSS